MRLSTPALAREGLLFAAEIQSLFVRGRGGERNGRERRYEIMADLRAADATKPGFLRERSHGARCDLIRQVRLRSDGEITKMPDCLPCFDTLGASGDVRLHCEEVALDLSRLSFPTWYLK